MAGTTTNRAYPYPTSTDAANIAANIQSLATSIDTDVNTNFALKASPTFTGTVTMQGALFMTGGIAYLWQPTITTNSTTGAQTLTIANLLTEIINYTGAGITTMTLPTGTLMDGGISGIVSNVAFDWSIVNTTANIITMASGATNTYVGNTSIAANVSARFRSVRTAATTWSTYRIA
jgi:hypothetical protein